MPFVNKTRLLVTHSMTGATGNIYAGLHEIEEMALTLHLLRPDDDFIDIGANIGSYTLLATGVVGSRSISIEPIPDTYEKLLDNIHLNRIQDRTTPLNMGIGDKKTLISFSTNQDTTNHILSKDELQSTKGLEVTVERLDDIITGYSPALIKIDVEGYEYPVLQGGLKTLKMPSLLAVIIETNGSGERYGYSDQQVDQLMREQGFSASHYEPFSRTFKLLSAGQYNLGNTIYIRDISEALSRVEAAPRFNLSTGLTI